MYITEKITNDRVRSFTSADINDEIDQQMEENVEFYSIQNPVTIKRRIEELDAEWDIERILELNASTLALTGIVMSAFGSKKWLLLSGLVTTFMVQHAIQGWCPPLELLRKLKVRTRKEIDMEKHFLLKALEERPDLQ